MTSGIRFGQHPEPTHTIAHVSDTHVLRGGGRLYGQVATEDALRRALELLERARPVPEALVFTGDLTDLGEEDAYARLAAIVEPAAARMGAVVVWVMGNHDERVPFARTLLGEEPTDEPQDRVHDVRGLRIVAIDTTVPGYHHGEIADAQLAWLADVLATPAPHGTVLAMHHPPVPTPLGLMAALELREQDRLAHVLRGSDVRAILGGHLHYTTHSTFAGIPVSVAAATCYTLSLVAGPDRFFSGVDGGQSLNLVSFYEDRVVHSVVPIGAFREVSGQPASVLDRLAPLSAEERLEALSSKSASFPSADASDRA